MTFLDAYALVALLAEEPAAAEVEALLRGEGECCVAPANLAEAVDVSQRVHGLPLEEVRAALEPLMIDDVLHAVPTGAVEAWLAAELRARHYDRKTRPLSLADCLLLAHAVAGGAAVATADPPLAAAARDEGVDVIALPDSTGSPP